MSKIIIAIDGYSSCGKSTLAKALAKKLNFVYVDSGAMYRATTLYLLQNNIDLTDDAQIAGALKHIHINLQPNNGDLLVFLNDENISDEIRQMPVSENVSKVSAIKAVRQAMVAQQQKLAKNANVVMDGRDIGTAVFPQAQLKIFMTADPKIRAERRFKELIAKGEKVSLDEIFSNLAKRDYEDTTRKESPLVKANDAIVLDNSYLNQEEQLDWVLQKYAELVNS